MTPDKPQFRKAIFPGIYLQGDGASSAVAELMQSLGGAGLVICAPSAFEKVLPGIADALPPPIVTVNPVAFAKGQR
jgi:hypothetical protein